MTVDMLELQQEHVAAARTDPPVCLCVCVCVSTWSRGGSPLLSGPVAGGQQCRAVVVPQSLERLIRGAAGARSGNALSEWKSMASSQGVGGE